MNIPEKKNYFQENRSWNNSPINKHKNKLPFIGSFLISHRGQRTTRSKLFPRSSDREFINVAARLLFRHPWDISEKNRGSPGGWGWVRLGVANRRQR